MNQETCMNATAPMLYGTRSDDRLHIAGDDFWLDQFFVLRKVRYRGVGEVSRAASAMVTGVTLAFAPLRVRT